MLEPKFPISGRIIAREGRLGVTYEYVGGKHETHLITKADWPTIRPIESEGQLTFTDENVRERFGVEKLNAHLARRGGA